MNFTSILSTRAVEESSVSMLQEKNRVILEEIKDTDWDECSVLDLVFYTIHNVVVDESREYPNDLKFSMGIEMIAMRYSGEPNDYDFYETIADGPEVLRIDEDYAQEVIEEWN